MDCRGVGFVGVGRERRAEEHDLRCRSAGNVGTTKRKAGCLDAHRRCVFIERCNGASSATTALADESGYL